MQRTSNVAHSVVFTAALSIVGTASPALASGGFGTVHATIVTDTTITIDWSEPSDKFAHCATPHQYRVCVKEAGAWEDACDSGNATSTQSKPYTITGLTPGERYKIKVYTKATKKQKNCDFRKVGTMKQETKTQAPNALVYGLSISNTTNDSLDARVQYSNPAALSELRVCYKKLWRPISLNARCQDSTPFSNPAADADRGFLILEPAIADFTFTATGLHPCRQYKVVAYGIDQQGFPVKIGEANTHVGGACKTFIEDSYITDSVDDDHDYVRCALRCEPNVAQAYLDATDAYYGGPGQTQAHLEATYSEVASDASVLEADGDVLKNERDLFFYLLEERPQIFQAWQSEGDLRSAGLNSAAWLLTNEPGLYQQLLEEQAVDVPALSNVGLTVLVGVLMLGGILLMYRKGAVGRRF